MSRPIKKKVIETHAKIETFQPTLLEQVWAGNNDMSRYGTLDERTYENRLNDMTRADLEREARSKGGIIVESTARIKEKLLSDFRGFVASLNKPASQMANLRVEPDARAAAQKVLSEGR